MISPDHLYQHEMFSDVVEFYDLRIDPGAAHDLGGAHARAIEFSGLEISVPIPVPQKAELEPAGAPASTWCPESGQRRSRAR